MREVLARIAFLFRHLICMMAVLGMGWTLHAQPFAFRHFDGRDGLPQSQVRALLEDRRGFLWVGTQGGVARLGASGFKSFGLAQGLGVGQVRSFMEDREGAIWVAQVDANLARIQGSQVQTFGPGDGLPAMNSYCLAEEDSGAVLVGTRGGLYRWNRSVFQAVELGLWPKEPIYGIAKAEGGFWLSTRKGRVGFWDGHQLREEMLPNEVAQREVWKIVLDPKGRPCALTRPGLFRREEGVWVPVQLKGYTGVPKIQDFNFDRDGSLVVGLGDDGLWTQSPEGSNRWWTAKDGLPEEHINLAYRDHQGILWVGSDGDGLYALALPGLRSIKAQAPFELGAVLAIEPLPGVGTFLGTSRGLFLWEEGKGLTARWTIKEGLPSNEIWSLHPDGKGGLWLGSAKGMGWWANGRVQPGKVLGDARVFQVLDWQDKNIVGTDHGLVVMDLSGQVKQTFEMPKEAGVNDAYVLTKDSESVLVGCSKGLYRFDGQRLIRAFPNTPFDNVSVLTLYREAPGSLWVGTVQGLYKYDVGRWTRIGIEEGLPDANIYFVGDAGQGRIAVGHGKGVTLIGRDGRMLHLNQAIGLLSNETNQGSVRLDDLGRLWFGMTSGVCVLDTREPLRLPEMPSPQVLEIAWPGGRIHLPAQLEIPPRHDFIEFNFEMGMPIFNHPPIYEVRLEGLSDLWQRINEGNTVRYERLPAGSYRFHVRASQDGSHWIEGAPVSLKVRPTWLEHPAGRAALLLLGLAVVGAFIQWRTLRLRKVAKILEFQVAERTRSLNERNQELEVAHEQVKQILESKVVFTRMVVHDLRSPITTINLLADQMGTEAQDRGEMPPPQLQVIAKEADRLDELLRRLLDQSRSEAVDQTLHMVRAFPHQLLDGMEDALRLKAEWAGLHFSWEVEPVSGQVLADALAIQQVLLNLFGNALKVTAPGGSLGVRSSVKGERWVLEIWDTGRGFDAGELERLFQPFTQVEISDIGKGWGLGLSIVKSLVDAHGANITVESKPGHGSTFRISFVLLVNPA
jgi:signal transduction histidine kinase/ligand-binding sensor domain-containing protein